MKRLFIGGLGHTVSEKDLKDRFGKFGDVSDVEIITRKDDHGRYWDRLNSFDVCIVKCNEIFGTDMLKCLSMCIFSVLSLQAIL